ncbi:thioester domain-containing protein [Actinomadura oligospora]|uniref:thioester domain-containing protein n=1 Tax=Actinomadura oligospora TaxID=111804 RepID=UPI00047A3838|nr:thioester domain-containing protein [Actinomadura oligospora]
MSARADLPPSAEFSIVTPGPGTELSGFVAPESVDPLHGYPSLGYDPSALRRRDIARAGIMRGARTDGTLVRAYCFDLDHPARGRMAYRFGSWGEAPARNLGYITRVIHEYYPNTSQPAGLSESEKAAAVQAAIWFFSNRYVLADTDPLFPATSGIVGQTLRKGPLQEPERPSLTISGPDDVRAGAVSGPFTVGGTAERAAITATGGEMFEDAAATRPIASGTELANGASFYVRSAEPGELRLSAKGSIVHPVGQAAVYVRETSRRMGFPKRGQKIILAEEVPVIVIIEKVIVVGEVPPPPVHRPSITVEKWVRPGTYSHVGQRLHFKLKVTNNGDVALNNVRVADHMRGLSHVRCERTTLAAGQSMYCTATYRVHRKDLRHQFVRNCAVAHARTLESGMFVTSQRACAQAFGHVPVTG